MRSDSLAVSAVASLALAIVAWAFAGKADSAELASPVTAEVYCYSGAALIDSYDAARVRRVNDLYYIEQEDDDGIKYSAVWHISRCVLEVDK